MSENYQHYLEAAQTAAIKGGKILTKYWGKLKQIEQKTFAWDLVTEADKESESIIIESITQNFPSHSILAEESGIKKSKDSEHLWCIDPLDGTTNYTHQFPMVCVSIALLINHEPVVGVIYNPIQNELFCAAKGLGATLNGKQITVSAVQSLERSLLVTGFAYDRKTTRDTNYKEFCYLTHKSQGVRRGGSAALDLAYIAAGRLDGYWERGLQPWDISAGIILVREAGGTVTAYDQSPIDIHSGRILASNGVVHEELSAAINDAQHFTP